jgi:hypothetical protein
MKIFFVEIFKFLRKIVKEEIEEFCCIDFYKVYIVNVEILNMWIHLVELIECYLKT